MHSLRSALSVPLCQCGLHVVPLSLIDIHMDLLAAERNDLGAIVFDSVVLTDCARSMLLCWPEQLSPFFVFHCFIVLFLPSVGWL